MVLVSYLNQMVASSNPNADILKFQPKQKYNISEVFQYFIKHFKSCLIIWNPRMMDHQPFLGPFSVTRPGRLAPLKLCVSRAVANAYTSLLQ